jgi:hypothetical protein
MNLQQVHHYNLLPKSFTNSNPHTPSTYFIVYVYIKKESSGIGPKERKRKGAEGVTAMGSWQVSR